MNEGEIIHICNRGVEKRAVFQNEDDYLRFVYNLYYFNDRNSSFAPRASVRTSNPPGWQEREKLVEILKWSLLDNHYHILVQNIIENGASLLAAKLGNGYTKYFNIKNERSGYLFQGPARIISVTNEPHFLYLPFYIDLNCLTIVEPEWKEKGIRNLKKAAAFMESYRWSSYLDYIGKDNFPFLINRDLFFELFDIDEKRYKKELLNWLNDYKSGVISLEDF